ncbi:MAG: hypothetical protein HYV07_11980 [Deltaproteobacteria bacterium]|nr:hypothetical protein [Deltaproteobacteria bacterium]
MSPVGENGDDTEDVTDETKAILREGTEPLDELAAPLVVPRPDSSSKVSKLSGVVAQSKAFRPALLVLGLLAVGGAAALVSGRSEEPRHEPPVAANEPDEVPPPGPNERRLRIITDPPGAVLLIDGEPAAGVSPRTVTVEGREVRVAARLDGYLEARATVRTSTASPTEVRLRLERARLIELTINPPSARIYVDGELRGQRLRDLWVPRDRRFVLTVEETGLGRARRVVDPSQKIVSVSLIQRVAPSPPPPDLERIGRLDEEIRTMDARIPEAERELAEREAALERKLERHLFVDEVLANEKLVDAAKSKLSALETSRAQLLEERDQLDSPHVETGTVHR